MSNYHAAAAGGDCFIAVEGEYADIAEGTGMFSFIEAADAFCGVFYYGDVVLMADLNYFVYPAGDSEGVHWYASRYSPPRDFINST